MRRLVARTMAQQLAPAVERATSPFQHALTIRAGGEFSIDGIGAFDLMSREAMLNGLQSVDGGNAALPFVLHFMGTRHRTCGITMMAPHMRSFKARAASRAHGPRLYVCQAPNAFICVSGLAPPKHQMRLYVCHQMRLYVCHQMRLYVCHQMRLYVCHQMRLYVCHQMCLLTQRSSLRSLTFARFARTFFNSLN